MQSGASVQNLCEIPYPKRAGLFALMPLVTFLLVEGTLLISWLNCPAVVMLDLKRQSL